MHDVDQRIAKLWCECVNTLLQQADAAWLNLSINIYFGGSRISCLVGCWNHSLRDVSDVSHWDSMRDGKPHNSWKVFNTHSTHTRNILEQGWLDDCPKSVRMGPLLAAGHNSKMNVSQGFMIPSMLLLSCFSDSLIGEKNRRVSMR